jgi:sugar/nucleoside kinase (ribokinase family)
MEKRFDVISLGNCAVDDLIYVPRYPVADSKLRVQRSERQCGGLAATALVAAARLGARCAYAGALGHDELSRFVESTFEREGIDTSYLVRRDDASPVHSRIIVGTETGTRNIFYEVKGHSGADENLPSDEFIRAAKVLLIDPWGEAGTLCAAQIARDAGIPVVSDIERNDFATFEQLFQLSSHLITSADFALEFTREGTPEAAALALWSETREAVVVTCGSTGSFVVSKEYSDRDPHQHGSFSVEVVDTTGCGDVFHGAYAAALAEGLPIDERIRLASATAALKATKPGGQSGIPTRAFVDEFLRTH